MNSIRNWLPAMMLALTAGCSSVPETTPPPLDLPIMQSWSGDFPVAELGLLPQEQQQTGAGYFDSPAAFVSVWAVLSPGQAVPAVNFREQMVVFHRNVNFYNRTRIFKVRLKDGVAEVLATETMSAIPVTDKVAMALAVIPRAGVQAIQAIQADSVRIPVRAE